jgi:hypothetical protein
LNIPSPGISVGDPGNTTLFLPIGYLWKIDYNITAGFGGPINVSCGSDHYVEAMVKKGNGSDLGGRADGGYIDCGTARLSMCFPLSGTTTFKTANSDCAVAIRVSINSSRNSCWFVSQGNITFTLLC